MSIISIVVVLFVVGLLLWGIQQFPINPTILRIIYVVVVIALVLWLLQAFGLWHGFSGSGVRL